MSEQKKIVIVIASGLDDERSSVAWSVANGGIKSGQDVTVFLPEVIITGSLAMHERIKEGASTLCF